MPPPLALSSSSTRHLTWLLGLIALVLATALFARCRSAPANAADSSAELDQAAATSAEPDWILVAGNRVPIGTRVVTWREPGGYDAYRRGKFFDREALPDGKRRYSERRKSAKPLELDELQQIVHQFVLHYDMAGTSRQCFKVLQDVRNLSVHFLLDVDGTIYQTLDLREKAWHATIANEFSVGVEIAHPGARAQPLSAEMRRWYEQDDGGWRMKLPKWMSEPGIRTEGFVARPARPDLISGPIHGKTYHQFDFTERQYEALAKLCAGLSQALPRIALEAPRAADGAISITTVPPDELRAFDGIVGHYHVQANKQDPGPAFQWERLLRDARRVRDERATGRKRDG